MKRDKNSGNENGKVAELRREIRALRASLREHRPECHDPRAYGRMRVRLSHARNELAELLAINNRH